MTDNALTIYQQFGQIQQAAAALYKSGYFQDATSEAQAIVKVMAGAELGLPPFASMAGINIQGGKPVLGGNLIATLIKNDPRYDYRVRTLTNTECAIEFYEHGKPSGVSTFTIEDARKAKVWSKKSGGFIPLTQHNQNWESYPRNMLFNRAISNGAKWFCPGVFGGAPVYTPEEMGLETDEDGVIIEGDFATSAGNTPPAPAEPERGEPKRSVNGMGGTEYYIPPSAAEPAVLPDDEQMVAEAAPADFFRVIIAGSLITRYDDNIHALKQAAKNLGYNGIPKAVGDRLEMYRAIKAHAAERDAADAALLFDPAGPDVGDGDNMPMSG